MKKFMIALASLSLMSATVAQTVPLSHGGGNGGDDLELELKKRSLQIGYFLNSTVGKKTFNMINPEAVIETIEKSDIDVVSGNVVDKYGTLRTCVNEADRALITCNLQRINELRQKSPDILTAMLFHEILGLMGVELGHHENVSLYPISSKIVPYHSIIATTPVTEAQIRPEFFGLSKKSYGITVINKKTKESLRMICLNDNIEINRCRNYSVVRMANDLQSPLVPEIISISPYDLKRINFYTIYRNSSETGLYEQFYTKGSQDAGDVFNLSNNLSLVDKKKEVSEKNYNAIIACLKAGLHERDRLLKEEEENKIAEEKAEKARAEAKVKAEEDAKIAKAKAEEDAKIAKAKAEEDAKIAKARAEEDEKIAKQKAIEFEKLITGTEGEKVCQRHYYNHRAYTKSTIQLCNGLSNKSVICLNGLIDESKDWKNIQGKLDWFKERIDTCRF